MKFFYTLFVLFILFSAIAQAQTETSVDTASSSAPEFPSVVPPSNPRNNADARVTLPALAQTRIANLTANISNRLDAAVRRLQNIAGRLESRTAKMEAEGFDTSTARATLAEGKAALAEAEIALTRIDSDVASFIGSETPRERWQILKETYGAITTNIRTAHQKLVETLLLLRTASVPPTPADTTTTETGVE